MRRLAKARWLSTGVRRNRDMEHRCSTRETGFGTHHTYQVHYLRFGTRYQGNSNLDTGRRFRICISGAGSPSAGTGPEIQRPDLRTFNLTDGNRTVMMVTGRGQGAGSRPKLGPQQTLRIVKHAELLAVAFCCA